MKDSLIKYILIYQLDAFVFKDELQEWCDKDTILVCSMDRNAAKHTGQSLLINLKF
jgi:hypothetical protein